MNESTTIDDSIETNLNNVLEKAPGTEFFESIDELPIARFQMFQNYLLQDAANGSDMTAVNRHFLKMDEYMKTEIYLNANIERRNLHVTFFSILEKINYRHMSYAALVKKMDGKDYSQVINEPGVKKIHDLLLKKLITHKETVDKTKKKKSTSTSKSRNIFQRSWDLALLKHNR